MAATPEELEALANRIDHEELWRQPGIDRDKMTPEAKDEAKAWTCATHFLLESQPDVFFDGILRDKSDDAFDDRLAASFGAER